MYHHVNPSLIKINESMKPKGACFVAILFSAIHSLSCEFFKPQTLTFGKKIQGGGTLICPVLSLVKGQARNLPLVSKFAGINAVKKLYITINTIRIPT